MLYPQIKYQAACGAGGPEFMSDSGTEWARHGWLCRITNKSSQGHKWHQQTLWVTLLALKVEGSEVGGRKLAAPPSYS